MTEQVLEKMIKKIQPNNCVRARCIIKERRTGCQIPKQIQEPAPLPLPLSNSAPDQPRITGSSSSLNSELVALCRKKYNYNGGDGRGRPENREEDNVRSQNDCDPQAYRDLGECLQKCMIEASKKQVVRDKSCKK